MLCGAFWNIFDLFDSAGDQSKRWHLCGGWRFYRSSIFGKRKAVLFYLFYLSFMDIV